MCISFLSHIHHLMHALTGIRCKHVKSPGYLHLWYPNLGTKVTTVPPLSDSCAGLDKVGRWRVGVLKVLQVLQAQTQHQTDGRGRLRTGRVLW